MKYLQNKNFSYLLSTPGLVKNWVLIVLAIVLFLISVISLRLNNLNMIELRNNVLVEDQRDGDIEGALKDLEGFVSSHMNTGLGQPLELVYSYDRAVQESREQAAATGVDTSVYVEAQAECEKPNIPLTVRAQCVQEFVVQNTPAGQALPEIEVPDKEPYIYNYNPSIWSFDIAGIALYSSLYFVVVVIARYISSYVALRHLRSKGLDELLTSKVESL